jgi:hypothetical protein
MVKYFSHGAPLEEYHSNYWFMTPAKKSYPVIGYLQTTV